MARLRRSGRIDLLRAHLLGTGFGPRSDFIDVEFVGRISREPNHFFGQTLRNDNRLPANQAMFQLLRDGLIHQHLETTVEYDVDLDDGRTNGELIRVELRPS